MKKFKFEIQNCITVEVIANDVESARMWLVENTDTYSKQMVDGSCYISDGEEVRRELL